MRRPCTTHITPQTPNTFKESEYADMAEALNLTLAMPHLIDEALAMQKKAAVAADATDYMEILHL